MPSRKDHRVPEAHPAVNFVLLWALAVLFVTTVEFLGLAFVDAVFR